MTDEKLPAASQEQSISNKEFENKDEALSQALDKLEKEAFPPKTKPEPIGAMF